jgi:hypothetical protein
VIRYQEEKSSKIEDNLMPLVTFKVLKCGFQEEGVNLPPKDDIPHLLILKVYPISLLFIGDCWTISPNTLTALVLCSGDRCE